VRSHTQTAALGLGLGGGDRKGLGTADGTGLGRLEGSGVGSKDGAAVGDSVGGVVEAQVPTISVTRMPFPFPPTPAEKCHLRNLDDAAPPPRSKEEVKRRRRVRVRSTSVVAALAASRIEDRGDVARTVASEQSPSRGALPAHGGEFVGQKGLRVWCLLFSINHDPLIRVPACPEAKGEEKKKRKKKKMGQDRK